MSDVLELPNLVDRTISAAVKALCAGKGMSADRLAAHLGVSHGTINNRLRSKTSWTAVEVRTMADLFGVRIADLYDGLGGRFKPTDPGGTSESPSVTNVSDTEFMQYRSSVGVWYPSP